MSKTKPSRPAPAFQFYADDWIGGTCHLTAEAAGAYLRLLVHQFLHGRIPSDPAILRRITGASDQALSEIADKFEPNDDGTLFNRRMLEESEWRKSVHEKKVIAGKARHSQHMLQQNGSTFPAYAQHMLSICSSTTGSKSPAQGEGEGEGSGLLSCGSAREKSDLSSEGDTQHPSKSTQKVATCQHSAAIASLAADCGLTPPRIPSEDLEAILGIVGHVFNISNKECSGEKILAAATAVAREKSTASGKGRLRFILSVARQSIADGRIPGEGPITKTAQEAAAPPEAAATIKRELKFLSTHRKAEILAAFNSRPAHIAHFTMDSIITAARNSSNIKEDDSNGLADYILCVYLHHHSKSRSA